MAGLFVAQLSHLSFSLGEKIGKKRFRTALQTLCRRVRRETRNIARLRDAPHLGPVFVSDYRPAESESINQVLTEAEAEGVDDRIRIRSLRAPVRLPLDPDCIEGLGIGQPIEWPDI